MYFLCTKVSNHGPLSSVSCEVELDWLSGRENISRGILWAMLTTCRGGHLYGPPLDEALDEASVEAPWSAFQQENDGSKQTMMKEAVWSRGTVSNCLPNDDGQREQPLLLARSIRTVLSPVYGWIACLAGFSMPGENILQDYISMKASSAFILLPGISTLPVRPGDERPGLAVPELRTLAVCRASHPGLQSLEPSCPISAPARWLRTLSCTVPATSEW